MRIFRERLGPLPEDAASRRWLYVPYDQLSDEIGPLAREDARALGIVLVESPWKAARRPYHKQKIAFIIANQRQFALEQAARGVAVRVEVAHGPYRETLARVARETGPLRVMRPAERELRDDLAPLFESGDLEEIPHEGWLTTPAQFAASQGGDPPWRMDRFYRHVRRDGGVLMDGDKPVGGKYSFDAENRKRWRGDPPAPALPTFEPDEVTEEACAMVAESFGDHPGALRPDQLAATKADAARLWAWVKRECLADFGPYQDAMSRRHASLFHSRISGSLDLHRLLPATVVREAAAADAPLASREGVVRQVLGWREFVRHVHESTDGFRDLPEGRSTNHLDARRELPAAFWGTPSGLACLDRTVEQVWDDGYGHHITRLMVLSNIAALLDVDPRALTDWFWVAYVDAFDWVVEPNVLGMGTHALGDLMTTKPYVSGSAYIDRMGDFCRDCAFDPKNDCPIGPMYWAYLERNRETLASNVRVAMPLRSLAKRADDRRRRDREVFERTSDALARGERLEPRPNAARAR